jgi:hypothetical protein
VVRNDRHGGVVTARPVTNCRSCGGSPLHRFLALGETPVANDLLVSEEQIGHEPRYPLDVCLCTNCSLVQLGHAFAAEDIFGNDYPYFSSFSDSYAEHARRHAEGLEEVLALGRNDLVVEVASNDGYLLRNLVARGVQVLGIEPTPGPAAAAREIGVPTMEAFFGLALAKKLRAEGVAPRAIVANNVLAHVPELNDFMAGLAHLAGETAVVTIENPSVRCMVDHVEYDTVYHEHACYLSTTAVAALASRHGLVLERVDDLPVHGGSLRWWLRRNGTPGPSAVRHLDEERAVGVADPRFYDGFAARVDDLRSRLRSLLVGLKADGASIAAYGAAAKGATLLNTTGVGSDLIDFVVDRNVHKQGRWIPGVGIPIVPPEAIVERRPDYMLLLAWNVRDEVLAQQADYMSAGGRFIVPVPEIEVLGGRP